MQSTTMQTDSPTLAPTVTPTLAEKLATAIADGILNGTLRPGLRLDEIIVTGTEHTVERAGCAVAVALFWPGPHGLL